MQKVFITKYVLSQGIIEAEMNVFLNDEHYKKKCSGKFNGYTAFFFNDEFHLTREDAIIDAEKRRKENIQSLTKQIDKLNKIVYE